MRRTIPILLVGAVAAFAVACSESAVAPARSDLSTSASDASLASGARGRDRSSTVLASLEISPNGGTYRIGDFEVVIPAGAVCDPSTTAYGPGHWDEDCTPLSRGLTVNVVAESQRNRVSVDFRPDIRFRPSAGVVTIRTAGFRQLLTSANVRQLSLNARYFQSFAMLYVPTGSQSRVDEARSSGDRSLVTHVDLSSGMVWRRIKHFSGYQVSLGFSCVGSTESGETIACAPESGGGLGGLGDSVGGTLTGGIVSASADTSTVWLGDPSVIVSY